MRRVRRGERERERERERLRKRFIPDLQTTDMMAAIFKIIVDFQTHFRLNSYDEHENADLFRHKKEYFLVAQKANLQAMHLCLKFHHIKN